MSIELDTDSNNKWMEKALEECVERLQELEEIRLDSEATGCWYWIANGELLGHNDKY